MRTYIYKIIGTTKVNVQSFIAFLYINFLSGSCNSLFCFLYLYIMSLHKRCCVLVTDSDHMSYVFCNNHKMFLSWCHNYLLKTVAFFYQDSASVLGKVVRSMNISSIRILFLNFCKMSFLEFYPGDEHCCILIFLKLRNVYAHLKQHQCILWWIVCH